jgi:AraC-like DNA-binding protein
MMNVVLIVISAALVFSAIFLVARRMRRHSDQRCDLPAGETFEPPPMREKYGNNRLPEFVRRSIVTRLTEHMNCDQPWLRVDLTLAELADAINVNSHHLSQIINTEYGKSFACYINEYRVQAACRLLSISSNKAILEVAMESGFSSKSSFNVAFKKIVQLTPSEFRRQYCGRADQSEQPTTEPLKFAS